MRKYYGDFQDRHDLAEAFPFGLGSNLPAEEEILFASAREGSAHVVIRQGEQLYRLDAKGCECDQCRGRGFIDPGAPRLTSLEDLLDDLPNLLEAIPSDGSYEYGQMIGSIVNSRKEAPIAEPLPEPKQAPMRLTFEVYGGGASLMDQLLNGGSQPHLVEVNLRAPTDEELAALRHAGINRPVLIMDGDGQSMH